MSVTYRPVVVLVAEPDLEVLQGVLDSFPEMPTSKRMSLSGWTDDMVRWSVLLGALAESIAAGDLEIGT